MYDGLMTLLSSLLYTYCLVWARVIYAAWMGLDLLFLLFTVGVP